MLLVKNLNENLDCYMDMDNSSTNSYSTLSVGLFPLTAVGTYSSRKDKWLETCLHRLHQKEMLLVVAQTQLSSRPCPSAFRGVSGPATHWVTSFGPLKFSSHLISHKCMCACPLDCYGFAVSQNAL